MLASLSNCLEEVGIELSGLIMAPNASRDYDKLTRTVGDYRGILDIERLPGPGTGLTQHLGNPKDSQYF